jgi:hypothetical protein
VGKIRRLTAAQAVAKRRRALSSLLSRGFEDEPRDFLGL